MGKQSLPKCCNACSRFLLWQAVCDSAWNSLRPPDELSYLQVSDTHYTRTQRQIHGSGLKWDIEFLAIHLLILFDGPEFCHVAGRSGYRGCMRTSNDQWLECKKRKLNRKRRYQASKAKRDTAPTSCDARLPFLSCRCAAQPSCWLSFEVNSGLSHSRLTPIAPSQNRSEMLRNRICQEDWKLEQQAKTII